MANAEVPDTNVGDTISRQAAIDALEQLWDMATVDGITASTVLKQVKTDIKNLPSAEPFIIKMDRLVKADERERLEKELCRKMTRQNLILLGPEMELVYPKRKGKWVRNIHDKIICNQCGMFGNNEWNFCPNCGADMRGEEDA